MEIQGKIIHNLGEQSGVSKAGNSWKKHEYVLETQESFPKQVHFDFFGERADQYPLNVGDVIKLSFDIESREYNGRWYTSIRGWKADKADASSVPAASPETGKLAEPQTEVNPAGSANINSNNDPTDDLPF